MSNWFEDCFVKPAREMVAKLDADFEKLDEPELTLLSNLKTALRNWDIAKAQAGEGCAREE